jgi:hypothetical protein
VIIGTFRHGFGTRPIGSGLMPPPIFDCSGYSDLIGHTGSRTQVVTSACGFVKPIYAGSDYCGRNGLIDLTG